MTDLVFDTGALIGIEKNEPRMTALLAGIKQRSDHVHVPATVLAQAWRGRSGQARLAIFLKDRLVTVEPITKQLALAAGMLCQQSGTSDIVDATVVAIARKLQLPVVTGDNNDIAALDSGLTIYRI